MAWPSDLVRTKDWGTEILYDADLEGQLDLICAWINDFADGTSGHTHSGSANDGVKIPLASSVNGILAVANGGTGSATQSYVDLTTDQDVAGMKTFTEGIVIESRTDDTDCTQTGRIWLRTDL